MVGVSVGRAGEVGIGVEVFDTDIGNPAAPGVLKDRAAAVLLIQRVCQRGVDRDRVADDGG